MGKFGLIILQVILAAGIGFGGVMALSSQHPAASPVGAIIVPAAGCDIKGNISAETGEHIYHVPGQRYYEATEISPEKGERWFCSEAEAQSAGWRKSKV